MQVAMGVMRRIREQEFFFAKKIIMGYKHRIEGLAVSLRHSLLLFVVLADPAFSGAGF